MSAFSCAFSSVRMPGNVKMDFGPNGFIVGEAARVAIAFDTAASTRQLRHD